MKLIIQEVAHHRNGIGGDPFYVIRFYDPDEKSNMLGFVFDGDEDETGLPTWDWRKHGCRAAVVDIDLAQTTVAFGENSWRGDHYAPALHQAIRNWELSERQLRYGKVEA